MNILPFSLCSYYNKTNVQNGNVKTSASGIHNLGSVAGSSKVYLQGSVNFIQNSLSVSMISDTIRNSYYILKIVHIPRM